MFDIVRKHTKLLMGVLFLLIIPSFVLFGIDGYTRMGDAGVKVATVNGKAITQSEWDNAHRFEVDRLRAIAQRHRPALEKIAAEHGARIKVVEVPPGPPVMSPIVA